MTERQALNDIKTLVQAALRCDDVDQIRAHLRGARIVADKALGEGDERQDEAQHQAQFVHCDGVFGNDQTLCGFTLDGDQGEIGLTSGRIDCPQCVAIVTFCRSLPAAVLPRAGR